MVLDEAQAIKSSTSARWKTLLGFRCRNRLLLTGTPIQNSMHELWALLHFIMPSLFDSHDEFSEWFSKDIEGNAENKGAMNEHQLRRLHMILKPFMLRRIKKNVQNELGDKVRTARSFLPLLRSTDPCSRRSRSTSTATSPHARRACTAPFARTSASPTSCRAPRRSTTTTASSAL